MNYFDKNRLLTIILVALMVVNIAALITIGLNSRVLKPDRDQRMERIERRGSKEDGRDRQRESFRERSRRFSRGMSRSLGLTPEQEQKMEELREANQKKMEPVMIKMDSLRNHLNEALGSVEIDEESVRNINSEVAELDRQIRNEMLEFNLEVRELLNDEQLEKYLKMHRRMRRGGDQRHRERMNMIMSI